MSNKMRRGFYRTDWNIPEIMFGVYDDEGGCDGEMGMRWHDLGNQSAARLECFEDAFTLLAQFGDVIERLAQTRNISEPEFANLLLECGFTDLIQGETE